MAGVTVAYASGSDLRIHLNRLDNLVQVVGHLHGPVGESGPADAPVAEDFVEGLLVSAVIGDRGGRILELVAGENADDALACGDDPFLAQLAGAGHAGG